MIKDQKILDQIQRILKFKNYGQLKALDFEITKITKPNLINRVLFKQPTQIDFKYTIYNSINNNVFKIRDVESSINFKNLNELVINIDKNINSNFNILNLEMEYSKAIKDINKEVKQNKNMSNLLRKLVITRENDIYFVKGVLANNKTYKFITIKDLFEYKKPSSIKDMVSNSLNEFLYHKQISMGENVRTEGDLNNNLIQESNLIKDEVIYNDNLNLNSSQEQESNDKQDNNEKELRDIRKGMQEIIEDRGLDFADHDITDDLLEMGAKEVLVSTITTMI